MVRAARSGKQNILEGSQASGTSSLIKQTNLVSGYKKLTFLPYSDVIGIINGLAMDNA